MTVIRCDPQLNAPSARPTYRMLCGYANLPMSSSLASRWSLAFAICTIKSVRLHFPALAASNWVSGKPIEEPVAWYGPIVMNSDAEIEQACAALRNGRFIMQRHQ
jgi:hypothetical protein